LSSLSLRPMSILKVPSSTIKFFADLLKLCSDYSLERYCEAHYLLNTTMPANVKISQSLLSLPSPPPFLLLLQYDKGDDGLRT
jgi:hypothetical protein